MRKSVQSKRLGVFHPKEDHLDALGFFASLSDQNMFPSMVGRK